MRRLAEYADNVILVATIAFVVIGATAMGLASVIAAARRRVLARVATFGAASHAPKSPIGARLA